MFRMNMRIYVSFALILLFAAVISRLWIQKTSAVVSLQVNPDYVFVLDAGHGGEDGGASSSDGTTESGINLSVTLKLDDLAHLLGMQTVLVRSTDTAVYSPGCNSFSEKKVSDLHNRAKLVNDTQQAFLVSIHQNFCPQSQYSGAQVFYNHIAPAEEFAEFLQGKLALLLFCCFVVMSYEIISYSIL